MNAAVTADPITVELSATHAAAAEQTAADVYGQPLRELSREQAVRVIAAHTGGMLLSRLGTTDDSHALAGDLVRSVLGDAVNTTLIVRVSSASPEVLTWP